MTPLTAQTPPSFLFSFFLTFLHPLLLLSFPRSSLSFYVASYIFSPYSFRHSLPSFIPFFPLLFLSFLPSFLLSFFLSFIHPSPLFPRPSSYPFLFPLILSSFLLSFPLILSSFLLPPILTPCPGIEHMWEADLHTLQPNNISYEEVTAETSTDQKTHTAAH